MSKPYSRRLSREEVAAFGAELDALRARIVAELGEPDARYIRRIRDTVRYSEFAGRVLLLAGLFPPAWIAGSITLGVSKILENMELGHNVIHGQYDWMNDPEFNSASYEWDNVCAASAWRRTHNHIHHTYTNVVGHDDDIGYGVLRIFPEQPWHPVNLPQPVYALAMALLFQYGVGVQNSRIDLVLAGKLSLREALPELKIFARKIRKQVLDDAREPQDVRKEIRLLSDRGPEKKPDEVRAERRVKFLKSLIRQLENYKLEAMANKFLPPRLIDTLDELTQAVEKEAGRE
jgi:linoleoyl-CoA desaturase